MRRRSVMAIIFVIFVLTRSLRIDFIRHSHCVSGDENRDETSSTAVVRHACFLSETRSVRHALSPAS
jgi:hypothetical protein